MAHRYGNYAVGFLAFIAMCALVSADPITVATATVNGSTYSFGSWATMPVMVSLTCVAGSSSCNGTYYCTDTANTCDPTASGTQYNGSINVSAEGTTYIRYASNNSTGGWGGTGSSTVSIDTMAPAITISDDASGTWTNNDTISVSLDDHSGSGVANVTWVVRSDTSCSSAQDADLNASGNLGATAYADSESTYSGKYICFRAIDNVGHENYTVSSIISHLDTVAPSIDAGSDRSANAQFTQGAAASDSESGIASYAWAKVSGPGNVYIGSPSSKSTAISADTDGNYVIGLTVLDNAGNSAHATFNLDWETTAPSIAIVNPGTTPAQTKTISASASKGTLYLSVTTGTVCDASLQFTSYYAANFNSDSDNGKKICYKAADDAGNTIYKMSDAIGGIQTVKPVLALTGSPTATIEVHSSYTDPGATATSKYEGDISSRIKAQSTVDKDVLGTYTITYSVADSAGNYATQVKRTVKVVDTTPPVLVLNGNASIVIPLGQNYTDSGATATDNYDGDITSKIAVGGSVDTTKAGTYTITYDVTDAAGNKAAQLSRTVKVNDNLGEILMGTLAVVAAVVVIAGAYFAYLKFGKGHHRGL